MVVLVGCNPIPGKRKHIFTGDEATVRRIQFPRSRYDGMVERVQEIGGPIIKRELVFLSEREGCRPSEVIPNPLEYNLLA